MTALRGPRDDEPSLAAVIAAAFRAYPDTPVLVTATNSLSRRQLWSAAAQLAPSLTTAPRGAALVDGSDVVAFTVGMLAAWLDARLVIPAPAGSPSSRLSQVIIDSAATCILGPRPFLDRLRRERPELDRSRSWLTVDVAGDAHPDPQLSLDQLPPVPVALFTSGTTGRPKGVQLAADPLARYLHWARSAFEVSEASQIMGLLPVSFDVGFSQLLLALISGGRLLLPQRPDPAAATADADPTILFCTPTFGTTLARQGRPLAALRHLLLAGEPLRYETVRALRDVVPADCRIVNGYGPTEATVLTTAFWLGAAGTDPARGDVPLGAPVAGAVLTRSEDGELLISGPGLSPGYLNRPDLDAASFSWQTQPGATTPVRVYRTGDLAVEVGGDLTMAGRLDDQVKIRGFRVEPAEVAATLLDCPGVSDCAVLTRRGADQSVTLEGFVVRSREVTVGEGTLRAWLQERLPPYMQLSRIHFLDTLPQTAHGKLDRAALLSSSTGRDDGVTGSDTGAGQGPAGTERASALEAIFRRHLGSAFSRELGLFEAGGTSVELLAVLADVRELAGRPTLGAEVLFAHPTVDSLAGYLWPEHGSGPAAGQAVPARRPARRRRPITSGTEANA